MAKDPSNSASLGSSANREKIGKNNPPKHSQFKPGIAPNPNGRPKGVRNRSTVLKEFLEATLKTKNPITGLKETLTVEQRMALSMIAQVLTKGNVQAWNSIKDDVYGKQKDSDINIHVENSPSILTAPTQIPLDEWNKLYGNPST